MADVFDITSSKKARNSYEDSGKFKTDWELKLRRDPRIKSPNHDKEETSSTSSVNRSRDPRQAKQQEETNVQSAQENWMPTQIDYRQVQTQYSIVRDSNVAQNMISTMYSDQQRQQYNTAYPTSISQSQGNQYQYHAGGMQQDYSQNQYQMPSSSYYSNMSSGDGNYIQAPPPPAWQAQGQISQEFRDVPRPPPPPRLQSSSSHESSSTQRPSESNKDDLKKEAIAQEVKQQRATLRKQRDEYFQKATLLKRELDVLQKQKEELLADVGSGSIPRETQRILKENNKLQVEIQTKLKAINNVIEMLSGIIGDHVKEEKATPYARETQPQSTSERSNSPAENLLSITQTLDTSRAIYNFVHYDPELHWCRICDVFPNSAKDFLMHLQSEQHHKTTKQHQLVDMPWHNAPPEPELPSNPDGPVKRTPIKGIQFFIPAQAWYCKLCDKWIGDLHCASTHLKSKLHIQNFTNFVEQNPHWETDWISDRQKAFSRTPNSKSSPDLSELSNLPDQSSNTFAISSDTKNKKRKKHSKDKRDSRSSSRDKKRKKKSKKRRKHSSDSSSSSSSSTDTTSDEELESDKSRSIRVAMRNKMKMQAQMILSEELGEKLDVLTKLVEDGTQRKQRKQGELLERSEEKTKEDKPDITILPKDKDILTFHAFRNKLKQSQNFKQSHAVSLSLLENRKDEDPDKRNISKDSGLRRPGEENSRAQEDNSRRSIDRESREKDSSRYSDDRSYDAKKKYERSRDRSRERDRHRDRYSPSRKKYDRYSPDRKYKRNPSPRKYGSPDRKRGSDKYEPYNRDKHRSYHDDKFLKRSDGKFNKNERKDKEGSKQQEDPKTEKNDENREKIKFPVLTSQQKKLPLIGRMPLFKKKLDADEKKSNENDKSTSKFSNEYNNTTSLPAPGLVHVTKLSGAEFQFTPENPPPPPQIIPDPPMIIPEPPQISAYMCAPPPPILSMHLIEQPEEQIPMMIMPQEPTEQKGGLPRDLQDALNIIFPGEVPKDAEGNATQEALMMAQYQMMETYGYTRFDGYNNVPPLPPDAADKTENKEGGEAMDPAHTEIDDLAMLGIDAEDLAAQNLQ